MKIRTMLIASAIAFGLFACKNANQNKSNQSNSETPQNEEVVSVTYSIDTEKSVVNWKGKMIGVYAHEGTMRLTEGSLKVTDETVTEGYFSIDMNSILTTDSDALYKMASREKLIGHLKTDDFFSTEKYPTATFKIQEVNGDVIKGDLTIKGVTNEETLTNVKLTVADKNVTVSGILVFDRQKYGVAYKHTMNDMVVSDDIELTVSISGKSK
jgi:polyisoprenoid-binding protein YceI